MKKLHYLLFTFIGILCIGLINVNAATYSEDFSKIFKDGKYTVNSVPIKNSTDLEVYLYGEIWEKQKELDLEDYSFSFDNCNSTYTVCDVTMRIGAPSDDDETHEVKISYNYDPSVMSKVAGYLEIVKKETKEVGEANERLFDLIDLNLVNYYNSVKEEESFNHNSAIYYIESLKKGFENSNVLYTLDKRMGDDMPLQAHASGVFTVYFNGVKYGYIDPVGVRKINVLYVPSDTANTTEAFIKAAKTRLEDYLKKVVKVELGDLRTSIEEEVEGYDWTILGDITLMSDHLYVIELNGVKYDFVLIKDTSKMVTPEYLSIDIITNVHVSTTAIIPLETKISVSEILDNATYKEKLGRTNLYTVDINLNSPTTKQKITKLDNGKFLVAIPIPASLNGKDLIVEYITSDGKIEKYEVTVKDGMAYFETDHFSIYSLGEVLKEELNPQTFDIVNKYMLLTAVSLMGLMGVSIYLSKKRFN